VVQRTRIGLELLADLRGLLDAAAEAATMPPVDAHSVRLMMATV
jgi:hypothetical protein